MVDPLVITAESGLVFKLHPALGLAAEDFRYNETTGRMEMVPFPSDIADADPERAIKLAKELGYTQDSTGAWCDPMLDAK